MQEPWHRKAEAVDHAGTGCHGSFASGSPHKRRREGLTIGLVLAASAALRLYGVNWDSGHWLHPDERQVYFVTLSLGWPRTLVQALGPDSPLNPHFFAYGSFPFYLLKLVAACLAPFSATFRDPDNLHLVGRPLAALFDLGTVWLTYRLARVFASCRHSLTNTTAETPDSRHQSASPDEARGGWLDRVLPAALVGLAVLHVQLAHSYTADTLLTFFVMLTLSLATDVARDSAWPYQLGLGAAFGLAMATKISAFALIFVILVAHWKQSDGPGANCPSLEDKPPPVTQHAILYLRRLVVTLGAACATFALFQPYTLIDFWTFLAQARQEAQIAWGTLDVPYTRQYAGTFPYVYPVWQTTLWGLGLPLGLVAWTGFAALVIRWLRRGRWPDTLLLAWVGPYLAMVGALHAHHLRYMLPLAPLLCLGAVQLFTAPSLLRARHILARWRPLRAATYAVLIVGTLGYCLAFVTIYTEPHPWILASEWIYETVPAGSTLAVEEWDTPLPLPLALDGRARRIEEYSLQALDLYDEPDDVAKWSKLSAELSRSDYLILASRRLYGSIPRLPDRYPLATRYYDRLLNGELGFEPAAEFTRGPAWLNPRLPPLPGSAPGALQPDESFVVYDHPRTLVLRNAERLPPDELLRRIRDSSRSRFAIPAERCYNCWLGG